MAGAVPLTQLGPTARIGVLADTHCHAADASDLPDAVLDAFRGVDLVVHLGDMGEAAVLDRLAGVAAIVVATRGRDDPTDDPRIASEARVIQAGDFVMGALFDLADRGLASTQEGRLTFPLEFGPALLAGTFGRRVDAVLFGATHRSLVAHYRGVLLVNPGSPTLPAPPGVTPGTVAIVELRSGIASVELLRI
jgi:hypothetical protein